MSGENRTEMPVIRRGDMDVGWYYCPYIPVNMPLIKKVLPEITAEDIVGAQNMLESETVVETFRLPAEIANELRQTYGLDLEQVLADALRQAIDEELGKIAEEPPKIHRSLMDHIDPAGLQGFDIDVQSYHPILQADNHVSEPTNLPRRRRST